MTFRVGQKVVAVRDDDDGNVDERVGLRRGQVYTIAEIGPFWPPRDTYGVRIVEIQLKPLDWWCAFCFRPLDERKTDISVFTSMLSPTRLTPTREPV
jgi:hypothetical protein